MNQRQIFMNQGQTAGSHPLTFWPKIRFLIVSTFQSKTNIYAKGTVIYNMGHTRSDNTSPEVEDSYCWCTCNSN